LPARARVAHRGARWPSRSMSRSNLRTVADQVALVERLGDLAVLDQVRLGSSRTRSCPWPCSRCRRPTAPRAPWSVALDDVVVGILARRSARTCSSSAPSGQAHVASADGRSRSADGPLLAGPQVVPHVVGEHAVLDAARSYWLGWPSSSTPTAPPLAAHRAVVDQRDQWARPP
jgi:hypothetical protein